MNNKLIVAGALCAVLGAGVVAATDDMGEGWINYRQGVMKSASGHMKAAGALLKNDLKLDGALVAHARALADMGPHLVDMFPADSDFGDTDAKAEVWSKRAEFEQAAKHYGEASAAFLKAAEGGDAAKAGAAMGELGKACKGCHKQFRED